jgi:hypothetical protein
VAEKSAWENRREWIFDTADDIAREKGSAAR